MTLWLATNSARHRCAQRAGEAVRRDGESEYGWFQIDEAFGWFDGEEACERPAVVTAEQQKGTEPEASKS